MDFLDTLVEPQLCDSSFFNSLTTDKEVGSGTFGVAILVHDPTGKTYIIKKLQEDELRMQKYNMERIRDEIVNHFAISLRGCPNICNIVCVNHDNKYINIVQEYCGKELLEYINNRNHDRNFFYTEVEADTWTEQLLLALKCIHELDIAHFDIKPANLLIDDEGNLKVIDFGVSQHKTKYSTGNDLGGTIGYIPLGAIKAKLFDYRNDCYAAGETINQIWSALKNNKKSPLPENVSKLINALTKDYDNTPTIEEALVLYKPDKYSLKKRKIEQLYFGLEEFDAAVNKCIDDYIRLGMIDIDTADMALETNSCIKEVYIGLVNKGMNISPEIVNTYHKVLKPSN